MRGECENNAPHCPYRERESGCFSDEHHMYWPRSEYEGDPITYRFRNLGENIIRLCRLEHEFEHRIEPPEMPSRCEMVSALEESGEHLSRSVRKAIKEHKNGRA